ncbi:MAG: hypothetical protein ACI9JN_002013, partial [Bacteroidia bacterium]
MKEIKVTLFILLVFAGNLIQAQTGLTKTRILEWNYSLHVTVEKNKPSLSFKNCHFDQVDGTVLPVYYERIPVDNANYRASLTQLTYETEPTDNEAVADKLQSTFQIDQYITYQQGKPILNVAFTPAIRLANGRISLLKSFNFNFHTITVNRKLFHKKATVFTTQSVLSQGDWFKFKVAEEGIYKITGTQIANLGIDILNTSAKTVKIFGFPGGPMSEAIPDLDKDDLQEFAIELVDQNGNDRFDPEDFIRFYAQSAHKWELIDTQYVHHQNVYDINAYVFLTSGGRNAKTLGVSPNGQGNSFDVSLDYFY